MPDRIVRVRSRRGFVLNGLLVMHLHRKSAKLMLRPNNLAWLNISTCKLASAASVT
jgi:hypothetical protein